MPLGSPITDKFPIGTAEIRLAPLNQALKMMPSHSIGQLDDVTISVSNTTVQKKVGFPQRTVANAITENVVTITGTVGEYSRRNMQILAGEAPEALVPDAASSLASAATTGATSITLAAGDGSKFTAGQLIVIYVDGRPELMQVTKIESITTDTITLATGLALLHDFPATLTKVFAAQPIGKAITKTNYFAAQVIQSQFSDGRPIAWNFWKVSNSGGLEVALNPNDFATTTIELEAMEPSAAEFQVGGPLAHVADLIAEYPVYLAAPGG